MKTTYGVIPQNKTFEYRGNVFRSRLPGSRLDPASDGPSDLIGGEWDKLIGVLFTGRTHPEFYPAMDDMIATSQYCLTKDFTGTSVITRGSTGGDSNTVTNPTTGTYWRPLIELLP